MAAGYAARELVQRGLGAGELTIVSADDALPYERPPLSKSYLAGKDQETDILINPADWYAQHGIAVRLQTPIEAIDGKSRALRTAAGEILTFENLLIATGARARRLACPGSESAQLFYLRSLADSRRLREAAAGARLAAVIGGGFIGMEVASVLAQKKIETTLIVPEERVWSRVFTPAMSEFFEHYYAARGVRLLFGQTVVRMEHTELRSVVVLASGERIGCDLAVAGVGAEPVTELFQGSSLEVDNGIVVNEFLETNAQGMSAAGDVARYQDVLFGKRRRVEHWDNAVSQGQHWATLMKGERQAFVHVPYFFSDIFDLSYELWGDAEGATETVVRGDATTSSFSVWWLKGERLVAAFAMNRPEEERQLAPQWIQSRQAVARDRLADAQRSLPEAAR